jgi:hypothetical protein
MMVFMKTTIRQPVCLADERGVAAWSRAIRHILALICAHRISRPKLPGEPLSLQAMQRIILVGLSSQKRTETLGLSEQASSRWPARSRAVRSTVTRFHYQRRSRLKQPVAVHTIDAPTKVRYAALFSSHDMLSHIDCSCVQ